ncbi:MAG: sigma-54-dependent Fis family transcriptional regulator [Desulfobacteraceae bacterium]|nr:sigma-54-dependent Fis family transcriptional regulator [Desulfobacteraceae bacterium]
MKKKITLTDEQRKFFTLVSDAVVANPFSDKRNRLDMEIAGFFLDGPGENLIDKTIKGVMFRISELEKQQLTIDDFEGHDRFLVETAFLFDFFYRFRKSFDELIQQQIKAGDTTIKVPFVKSAYRMLESRGFDNESIYLYFALCYQIRRAFYFIRDSLIGQSQVMKEFKRKLWNNVFTHDLRLYEKYLYNRMEDFSTLILGETGTGKGTAAIAIGRSGFIPFDEKRKCFEESFTRSFVSLNLSQFPETLIESELFGHKKGSFTGAVENFEGVFQKCSRNGAIFLDEIGEISEPVQIKLLQVLQDRVFTPVGSHKSERFNGRVIAATNRNLNEIENGRVFRDDFYYRLCSDIINVPPLRQRIKEDPDELNRLVFFTVKRIVGKDSPECIDMVLNVIENQLGRDYEWPGNVRELEQCTRSVLLNRNYSGKSMAGKKGLEELLVSGLSNGEIGAQELMSGYCRLLYERFSTFEEVARRTGLDRRTVKKYINSSPE